MNEYLFSFLLWETSVGLETETAAMNDLFLQWGHKKK